MNKYVYKYITHGGFNLELFLNILIIILFISQFIIISFMIWCFKKLHLNSHLDNGVNCEEEVAEYGDEYSENGVDYTSLSISESNLLKQRTFDDKISRLKDELAKNNSNIIRKPTSAEILMDGIKNLPHDAIENNRSSYLPDVEITK